MVMTKIVIIPFIRGAAFGAGVILAMLLLSWLFGPAKADEYLPPERVTVPECIEILETESGEMFLLKYLGG